MAQTRLQLGCVADDFTGAGDAASFLSSRGIRTLLYNGIPLEGEAAPDCDAVVIALKTRSVPAEEAVRDTLSAMEALRRWGARRLYFKYCSTFDSTPGGNIGPVADAVLECIGIRYTLLCPALPVNGRTVKNGRLLVHGVPLHQSHMQHHPLNPMWSDRIGELMRPQSRYPCLTLAAAQLSLPDREVFDIIEAFGRDNAHFYIVPDYENEEQAARISSLFGHIPFLTGGSGLLAHLPLNPGEDVANFPPSGGVPGRAILLSGSCSQATGEQIRAFCKAGGLSIPVTGQNLLSGGQTAEGIWEEIAAQHKPVLLHSAGALDPSAITSDSQKRGEEAAALESLMMELGQRAVKAGFTRIIVAGGETSGAVMTSLGFHRFLIGASIAPGVPVMIPVEHPELRVVLKSGNFGDQDFFCSALAITAQGG